MSENISSIIDNELKGKDLDHGLNELSKNSSALSSYRTYQMISDVMRNDYYDVNLKYARLKLLGIERKYAEVYNTISNITFCLFSFSFWNKHRWTL